MSEPWTDPPSAPHWSRTSRRRWRIRLAAAAVVTAAAIVPYLNALSTDFTFDDIHLIRDNAAVQIRPALGLLTYVYSPGGLYRPLTMLTYAANASVSRDAFSYHLVNVLLHAAVSLGVFLLALRLTPSIAVACVAAVLFAVHPIHTEAVTGVVGRAELLAALGVIGSLLAFLRARHRRSARPAVWWAISLLAFGAAILAKESAFTALGLIAVLEWWRGPTRERPLRARLLAAMGVVAPYAGLALAYLGLRLLVVGSLGVPEPIAAVDNPLAHTDTGTRVRTAVVVLSEYAAQLTIPARFSADYSFNQIPLVLSWTDPRLLGAAVLFVAVAVASASVARRRPILLVALLFAVIPLALTANLLFPIGTIKGERLLYLPSVGWCLAIAYLAMAARRRHHRATALALTAVLVLFAARTWTRNADWTDDATLFAATVESSPDSAKANHNAGVVLQRAGHLDDAMLLYRRALEVLPEYASAAFGIGNIYRLKRLDAGALHWYEEALRSDPRSVTTHMEIALVHERHGEYDAAEAAILAGLEIDPNDPMLLVCLSAVKLAQGDEWQSRTALARLDSVRTLDANHTEQIAAARHTIEAALQ